MLQRCAGRRTTASASCLHITQTAHVATRRTGCFWRGAAAPALTAALILRSRAPATRHQRSHVVRHAFGSEWSDGTKGTEKPDGAARPAGERERSMLVNEEVVYFIFQLDLDTQLQRCLNYEAYEAAQEVRKKRQRVDEAVQTMRERKARNTGMPASSTQLGAADFATEGLRLRSEMQRAVEAENYGEAAKYRDLLRELETQVKKAAALAAEWDTTSSSSSVAGGCARLGVRRAPAAGGLRGGRAAVVSGARIRGRQELGRGVRQ
ncbi:hypothetical protein PLESTB_001043400 [Pleodorina starrii]|uniref:UVR domain-containing protein n=1 Tax=Pleodorina starrii TaxID=330485 RepID=A0A9W6BQX4_9CHLO|nr:hypothetical protein PLESTB_001043400 [Pleodorina starrii]